MQLGVAQERALQTILEGHNCFISGPAGTGKTVLIDAASSALRASGKFVKCAASTGIAALHVRGVTIHRLLGLGIAGNVSEGKSKQHNRTASKAAEVLLYLDVLILDEVSMLTGDYIDMLDWRLRKVRCRDTPFGGVQVIMVGDLLQLPAVDSCNKQYIFQADVWDRAGIKFEYLEKIYRQEGDVLVDLLMDVRTGSPSKKTLQALNNRVQPWQNDGRTVVATHRRLVDAANLKCLEAVEGRETEFFAQMWSRFDDEPAKIAQQYIAPWHLRLKEGASVMCCKNLPHLGLVNGSQGIVREIERDGVWCSFLDHLHGHRKMVRIERETWEILDHQDSQLSSMTQFPLILGWAITIHKSQGMSMDRVHVDCGKAFCHGQAYVAMSRCRTLEGLSLQDPLTAEQCSADKKVVDYYSLAERGV